MFLRHYLAKHWSSLGVLTDIVGISHASDFKATSKTLNDVYSLLWMFLKSFPGYGFTDNKLNPILYNCFRFLTKTSKDYHQKIYRDTYDFTLSIHKRESAVFTLWEQFPIVPISFFFQYHRGTANEPKIPKPTFNWGFFLL